MKVRVLAVFLLILAFINALDIDRNAIKKRSYQIGEREKARIDSVDMNRRYRALMGMPQLTPEQESEYLDKNSPFQPDKLSALNDRPTPAENIPTKIVVIVVTFQPDQSLSVDTRVQSLNETSLACPQTTYKIAPGDTCYSIATKHAMRLSLFIQLNLLDCSSLQPGDQVCVDARLRCKTETQVLLGQSCDYFAGVCGVPVAIFQLANPSINCSNIIVGWPICDDGCNGVQVVVGNGVKDMAAFNEMTSQALQALNPTIVVSSIKQGDIVCVRYQAACSGYIYRIKDKDTLQSLRIAFKWLNDQTFTSLFGLSLSYPVLWPVCVPQSIFAECSGMNVTVKQGDICSLIANTNGISLKKLYGMNPSLNCNQLKSGQSICVPPRPTGCIWFYQVMVGDTCERITSSVNINFDQLIAMNPYIEDCNKLVVDWRICVPKSTKY